MSSYPIGPGVMSPTQPYPQPDSTYYPNTYAPYPTMTAPHMMAAPTPGYGVPYPPMAVSMPPFASPAANPADSFAMTAPSAAPDPQQAAMMQQLEQALAGMGNPAAAMRPTTITSKDGSTLKEENGMVLEMNGNSGGGFWSSLFSLKTLAIAAVIGLAIFIWKKLSAEEPAENAAPTQAAAKDEKVPEEGAANNPSTDTTAPAAAAPPEAVQGEALPVAGPTDTAATGGPAPEASLPKVEAGALSTALPRRSPQLVVFPPADSEAGTLSTARRVPSQVTPPPSTDPLPGEPGTLASALPLTPPPILTTENPASAGNSHFDLGDDGPTLVNAEDPTAARDAENQGASGPPNASEDFPVMSPDTNTIPDGHTMPFKMPADLLAKSKGPDASSYSGDANHTSEQDPEVPDTSGNGTADVDSTSQAPTGAGQAPATELVNAPRPDDTPGTVPDAMLVDVDPDKDLKPDESNANLPVVGGSNGTSADGSNGAANGTPTNGAGASPGKQRRLERTHYFVYNQGALEKAATTEKPIDEALGTEVAAPIPGVHGTHAPDEEISVDAEVESNDPNLVVEHRAQTPEEKAVREAAANGEKKNVSS